jgi:hypothetical protein
MKRQILVMTDLKQFLKSLAIKEQDFILPKDSNLFIGGITGRTGKSFLLGILESILGNEYVTINEHGSFVLSQVRYAGYEFYQVGGAKNKEKKEHYLDYFYRFVTNEAYDRWKIYGSGLRGFRKIVPKKAIKMSFRYLREDLKDAKTLGQCNVSFGKFYSRLLTYHSISEAGTCRWISEETCYGRLIRDVYSLIPDCRVVIMVRDGRNSILSMAERRWNDADVFQLVNRWKDFTKMTLDALTGVPAQNYLLVRFESLVTDFQETLEKILEFYRIDLSDGIIRKIEKEKAKYAHLKNNLLGWEKHLADKEIRYFRRNCEDLMKALGYEMTD